MTIGRVTRGKEVVEKSLFAQDQAFNRLRGGLGFPWGKLFGLPASPGCFAMETMIFSIFDVKKV